MGGLLQRSFRASLLDRRAFGEWLFETGATGDAALLVIGVTLVQAIGSALRQGLGVGSVLGLVGTVIFGLAGWIFLALATWFAGTKMFQGSGDVQTVVRLHGLAYLPNLLAVLGTIPAAIGNLWFLVGASVATSVALSLKTREAVLSVLIGAAILLLIGLLLGVAFAGVSGIVAGIRGLGGLALP